MNFILQSLVNSALFVPQRRMHLSAIAILLLQEISQILVKKCTEKIPAVCPGLHNLHVFGKLLEVRVPPTQGGGCHKYLSIGFCILAERPSMKMDT